jgi:hypothetical protein
MAMMRDSVLKTRGARTAPAPTKGSDQTNIALVENAQHDIDRRERRHDPDRFVARDSSNTRAVPFRPRPHIVSVRVDEADSSGLTGAAAGRRWLGPCAPRSRKVSKSPLICQIEVLSSLRA